MMLPFLVLFSQTTAINNICAKNVMYYTSEELIDQVICTNAAYRHIIFDKVFNKKLIKNINQLFLAL